MELKEDTVIEAFDRVGLDHETSLYREYSGRGMMGDHCIGVTGSSGDATKFLIGLTQALMDDNGDPDIVMTMCEQQSTDNMGLDIITYWPRVKLAES